MTTFHDDRVAAAERALADARDARRDHVNSQAAAERSRQRADQVVRTANVRRNGRTAALTDADRRAIDAAVRHGRQPELGRLDPTERLAIENLAERRGTFGSDRTKFIQRETRNALLNRAGMTEAGYSAAYNGLSAYNSEDGSHADAVVSGLIHRATGGSEGELRPNMRSGQFGSTSVNG